VPVSTKKSGKLIEREPLIVPQKKQKPVVWRQLVQNFLQAREQLPPNDYIIRLGRAINHEL